MTTIVVCTLFSYYSLVYCKFLMLSRTKGQGIFEFIITCESSTYTSHSLPQTVLSLISVPSIVLHLGIRPPSK